MLISATRCFFANAQTVFAFTGGTTVVAQNATFSGCSLLASSSSSYNYLALTNCVLANVTNLVSGSLTATNGNFNGFYRSRMFGLNPSPTVSTRSKGLGQGVII